MTILVMTLSEGGRIWVPKVPILTPGTPKRHFPLTKIGTFDPFFDQFWTPISGTFERKMGGPFWGRFLIGFFTFLAV